MTPVVHYFPTLWDNNTMLLCHSKQSKSLWLWSNSTVNQFIPNSVCDSSSTLLPGSNLSQPHSDSSTTWFKNISQTLIPVLRYYLVQNYLKL
jgi:hypothetical protein